VNNTWRYVTETHWRTLSPVFHEGTTWRDVYLPVGWFIFLFFCFLRVTSRLQ
jgi:hypothetical protein